MEDDAGDITVLLHRWRGGNKAAENQLFEMILPDLQQIARRQMQRERKDHTLEPTELVNQIYERLVSARDRDWESRQHFFAIAALAMRRMLIDHSRQRRPLVYADEEFLAGLGTVRSDALEQALEVNGLIDALHEVDPDLSLVVELKFILGLTDEEAADVIGVNVRTVKRRWGNARRWLYERNVPSKAS
jgi:RNA polymerase sigma-70 factor, ECF subfamily